MFSWFSKPAAPPVETPVRASSAPPGERIYVVGDIHGRADLLEEMLGLIRAHDDAATAASRRVAVFLGDYVDRGPDSRRVVERLLDPGLEGFSIETLLGNHEAALLEFLEEPTTGANWMTYGGLATLASYGVAAPSGVAGMKSARDALRSALPAQHLTFFRSLRLALTRGDYFFCHAGVRPGVPLPHQSMEDLLWIRNPFLEHRGDLDKVVVHGHTISDVPEFHSHRIGIDTGAYFSGRLTCLVLEGKGRTILQTTPPPPDDLDAG